MSGALHARPAALRASRCGWLPPTSTWLMGLSTPPSRHRAAGPEHAVAELPKMGG